MNKKILFAIVTFLFAVGFAQGAHLTYYDSGLWGQVNYYINDEDGEFAPNPSPDFGSTSCYAEMDGDTYYSYAYGSMSGAVTEASHWGSGLGTAVTLNASANCYSEEDPSAEVSSYGTVGTLQPAYTGGIFFIIESDEEETAGDPVQIQMRWIAQCFTFYGNVQADVSGDGTIYLTRNVSPPLTEWPPTTGIMWSRSGETFTGSYSVEDTGLFDAEIGDIIGIFLGANANASLSGEGSSAASVSTSMELLVVPEPATICLLGLGVLSLIRRKKH